MNNQKQIKNWTYHEGKALLSVYAKRKDEYYQTTNKKDFWQAMLTDLEGMNVLVSPTTVEQVEAKWRTLYRAYKAVKARGTASDETRFMYIEEMEKIFHDNPIKSSHSVTVGLENNPTPAPLSHDSVLDVTPRKVKRERQQERERLLDIKKKYYEDKISEKRKKRELLEQYLERKEKATNERYLEIFKLLSRRQKEHHASILARHSAHQ